MPRPRRLLFLSLAAVVVGLAVAWLSSPRSAITAENAAKIMPGMTRAEVEAILQGPERDETSGTVTTVSELGVGLPPLEEMDVVSANGVASTQTEKRWITDNLLVSVIFDADDPDGRVAQCECHPLRRIHESPSQMIRRWLRL